MPHKTLRACLGLSFFVVSAGCAHRSGHAVQDAAALALARSDVAWDARDADGFAPVLAALSDAELAGADPVAHGWRYARAQTAWGLSVADDTEAMQHFALARSVSLRCLDGVEAFRVARQRDDWEGATSELPDARTPCLSWATWSWVRWLDRAGADGAAIDHQAVGTLAAHMPLSHDSAGGLANEWVLGLVDTLDSARIESAQKHLESAQRTHPEELWIQLDLAAINRSSPLRTEQREELLNALKNADPRTPEDREAARRAANER